MTDYNHATHEMDAKVCENMENVEKSGNTESETSDMSDKGEETGINDKIDKVQKCILECRTDDFANEKKNTQDVQPLKENVIKKEINSENDENIVVDLESRMTIIDQPLHEINSVNNIHAAQDSNALCIHPGNGLITKEIVDNQAHQVNKDNEYNEDIEDNSEKEKHEVNGEYEVNGEGELPGVVSLGKLQAKEFAIETTLVNENHTERLHRHTNFENCENDSLTPTVNDNSVINNIPPAEDKSDTNSFSRTKSASSTKIGASSSPKKLKRLHSKLIELAKYEGKTSGTESVKNTSSKIKTLTITPPSTEVTTTPISSQGSSPSSKRRATSPSYGSTSPSRYSVSSRSSSPSEMYVDLPLRIQKSASQNRIKLVMMEAAHSYKSQMYSDIFIAGDPKCSYEQKMEATERIMILDNKVLTESGGEQRNNDLLLFNPTAYMRNTAEKNKTTPSKYFDYESAQQCCESPKERVEKERTERSKHYSPSPHRKSPVSPSPRKYKHVSPRYMDNIFAPKDEEKDNNTKKVSRKLKFQSPRKSSRSSTPTSPLSPTSKKATSSANHSSPSKRNLSPRQSNLKQAASGRRNASPIHSASGSPSKSRLLIKSPKAVISSPKKLLRAKDEVSRNTNSPKRTLIAKAKDATPKITTPKKMQMNKRKSDSPVQKSSRPSTPISSRLPRVSSLSRTTSSPKKKISHSKKSSKSTTPLKQSPKLRSIKLGQKAANDDKLGLPRSRFPLPEALNVDALQNSFIVEDFERFHIIRESHESQSLSDDHYRNTRRRMESIQDEFNTESLPPVKSPSPAKERGHFHIFRNSIERK